MGYFEEKENKQDLVSMLLTSEKPSEQLQKMMKDNLLPKCFKDLVSCEHENPAHPEGSVWNHTLLVVDQAAKLIRDKENKMNLNFDDKKLFMLGALTHDLGKAAKDIEGKDGEIKDIKQIKNGKGTFLNHNKAGVPLARDYVLQVTGDEKIAEKVANLVDLHMRPYDFSNNEKDISELEKNKDNLSEKAQKKLQDRRDKHEKGFAEMTEKCGSKGMIMLLNLSIADSLGVGQKDKEVKQETNPHVEFCKNKINEIAKTSIIEQAKVKENQGSELK